MIDRLKDESFLKVVDVAVRIMVPVLLALIAWLGTTIIQHDRALQTLQASQYSIRDAQEGNEKTQSQLREVLDKVHQIDKKVTEIATEIRADRGQ